MKNPKSFSGATANDFKRVIDKSATGSGDLKHNGTRPWKGATSADHFKPTKKSVTGTSDSLPGTARSEMQTSMTHFKPTPVSKPGVPADAKKWHRKGRYDMTSPS